MNIHELSRRTGVTLTKLRAIERLGALKVDAENATAQQIQFTLSRNPVLTLASALALLDDPSLIYDLGHYEKRARAQIDQLGNVKPAPRDAGAAIEGAAHGDEGSCAILAKWLASALPTEPVPYLWIAVRLLVALPETLRASLAGKVNIALAHVRKRADFEPYWSSATRSGKVTILYHKPRLDL